MRFHRRSLPTLRNAFMAMLVLFAFAGVASPDAKVAALGWTLIDNHQKVCVRQPILQYSVISYGIWISGSWSKPITVGISGLPNGSLVSANPSNKIAAGSNDGVYSLVVLNAQLPVTTPAGTYTAMLTATDGTSQQSVPVTYVVAPSSCRHY